MGFSNYQEDTLAVDGTSTPFNVYGNCDLWVSNLTSGSVKFQIAFPSSPTTWYDVPNGEYTDNTYTTIFVSEHGVYGRFVGVSNNADVFVRIARGLNG